MSWYSQTSSAYLRKVISCLAAALFLLACESDQQTKDHPLSIKSKQDYQELMINSHKAYLQKERKKLDHFTDSLPYEFMETKSGLRFTIIETQDSGDSIRPGDIAVIDYTLTLLNGDTAYQSQMNKPQEFMVNMDNVEAGLHEGIQRIAVGDRAIMVLPAHLAHGLTGDQAAIPIQTPVVYYLQLLAKK